MTGQTIAAGYLIIGVSLLVLGGAIVAFGRSALAERRATRAGITAEDIAKHQAWIDEVLSMSEPEWATKPDPRERLRLVPPLKPSRFRVPVQRRAGADS